MLLLLGISTGCIFRQPTDLVDHRLLQAETEITMGHFSSAAEILQALITNSPNDPTPALALTDCYLAWGKPQAGLAALEEAARRGASPDEIADRRLALLQAAGAWSELRHEATLQLKTRPADITALSAMVEASLQLGDCESARDAAARLAQAAPTRSANRILAVLEGNLELVREHAPDLLQADEICEPHCKLLVGYRLVEQEAWGLAHCVLQQAVRTEPVSAEAHAWLGESLERLGHSQQALAHFQQATQLAPASPLSWLLLGKYHMTHHDLDAAEDALGRARELDPGNPALYLAIAELCASRGQYAEMTAWNRKAVSLVPDDPDLWQAVARMYLTRMLIEDPMAMEAARRAVSLAPDAAESHALLGWAYLLRSEPQSALLELQKAVDLGPASGEAHYLLSQALRQMGKVSAAKEEEIRAADLGYPTPGSP